MKMYELLDNESIVKIGIIADLNSALEDSAHLNELYYSIESMTDSLDTLDSMIRSLTELTEHATVNVSMESNARKNYVDTLIICANEILRPVGNLTIDSMEYISKDSYSTMIAIESIKDRIKQLIAFFKRIYEGIKKRVIEFLNKFKKGSETNEKNIEIIKKEIDKRVSNYSKEKENQVVEILKDENVKGQIVKDNQSNVVRLIKKATSLRIPVTDVTDKVEPISTSTEVGPMMVNIHGIFLKGKGEDFKDWIEYSNNTTSLFGEYIKGVRVGFRRYYETIDVDHIISKKTLEERIDASYEILEENIEEYINAIPSMMQVMDKVKSLSHRRSTGFITYFPVVFGGFKIHYTQPLTSYIKNYKFNRKNKTESLNQFNKTIVKAYKWGLESNENEIDKTDRKYIIMEKDMKDLSKIYSDLSELIQYENRSKINEKLEDYRKIVYENAEEYLNALIKNDIEDSTIIGNANDTLNIDQSKLTLCNSMAMVMMKTAFETIAMFNARIGKALQS